MRTGIRSNSISRKYRLLLAGFLRGHSTACKRALVFPQAMASSLRLGSRTLHLWRGVSAIFVVIAPEGLRGLDQLPDFCWSQEAGGSNELTYLDGCRVGLSRGRFGIRGKVRDDK
jgi:hypothetical protein